MVEPRLARRMVFCSVDVRIGVRCLLGRGQKKPGKGWFGHIDETINARWALMLANSYLDDNPRQDCYRGIWPGIDFLVEGAEDARQSLRGSDGIGG